MFVPKWAVALAAVAFVALVVWVGVLELSASRYKYSVRGPVTFRTDLRTGQMSFTVGQGWKKFNAR